MRSIRIVTRCAVLAAITLGIIAVNTACTLCYDANDETFYDEIFILMHSLFGHEAEFIFVCNIQNRMRTTAWLAGATVLPSRR